MEPDEDLAQRIFGSDDDDDDEYMPAAASGELDEDDLRAQQILASKQKKKKEKEPTKRKRLQKGGKARASSSEVAEGDETVEVVNAYEDADKDSLDGSEAMEDNTPEEGGDLLANAKKKQRGGAPNVPRQQQNEEIRTLQDRMEKAGEEDTEALNNKQPAIAKVAMLPEVTAMLRKNHYHEAMIDCGMLTSLAQWLKPMDDGSLVNLQVRRGVLAGLTLLPVDETMLGSLRSSNIGKYVKLLTLHCKENAENKKLATSLVEKWSRPIFRTSTIAQASDLPTAPAPRMPNIERHDSQSLDGASASRDAASRSTHTRVPRPVGMDFSLLPASSVAPLPSNKHAKESTKGRLADRILTTKRKVQAQATSLSLEGRGMDKM